MSLRTQFAGYEIGSDLSSSDWTLRLSANATATIQSVKATKITQDRSNSALTAYTFSSQISTAGRYVIGVFGEGGTSGIASVEVNGLSADEIEVSSDGIADVGLYAVDVNSVSNGDVVVTFNSGPRDSCGIIIWELEGLSANTADDTIPGTLGNSALIDTNTRTAIIGVAGSTGTATNHFWTELVRSITQTVNGSAVQSGAEINKEYSASDVSVNLNTIDNTMDGAWVAAAWDTPVPEMPSGAGAAFAKQSSDANTMWSWNRQDVVADCEALILIRPTADSDSALIGLSLRQRGSAGSESSYSFVLRQSSAGARDQIAIIKTNGSATISLVGAAVSFAWSLNTNYWMRFRVRGSTLQGRIWADGGDEPTTWNIERTDSDVSAAGYSGIWHVYTGTAFLIGHFESKELAAEWPSTVPDYWEATISGGPQQNKVSFDPRVGPSIERKSATATNRKYRVSVPGLDLDEFTAFVAFHKTTLAEGTLPFTHTDPFTGVEKTFKFGSEDPAYEEELMRPPGSDYLNGLYKVTFSVVRLD